MKLIERAIRVQKMQQIELYKSHVPTRQSSASTTINFPHFPIFFIHFSYTISLFFLFSGGEEGLVFFVIHSMRPQLLPVEPHREGGGCTGRHTDIELNIHIFY